VDPIDEKLSRRPDFQGGRPIVLADGQEWSFPCPTIEFAPRRQADGSVKVTLSTAYGAEFDRLVDAVSGEKTMGEEAQALFSLAIDLLDRNYALSPDQLFVLLRYPQDGMWSETALGQIFDVAVGRGPKPTPAGSSSA